MARGRTRKKGRGTVGRLVIGVFLGVGMMLTPMTSQTGWWSAVVMVLGGMGLVQYLLRKYGAKSLGGIAFVAFLGVTIEYIGLKTCFPYGCFSYTDLIGPRVAGTFPVSLFVIRPLIVASINQFVPTGMSLGRKSLLGGVLLVAFDLLLDPVAVALGLRTYAAEGTRFGVPRTNYLGWLLTGTVSSWIVHRLSGETLHDSILHCVALVLRGMYGSGFVVVLLWQTCLLGCNMNM